MAFWNQKPRFETDERLRIVPKKSQIQADLGLQMAQRQAQNTAKEAQRAAQKLKEIQKFKAMYP